MKKIGASIIGMACEFPGARNLDEFWSNLLQGIDSVKPVPPSRFNVKNYTSVTDKETQDFLESLKVGMISDPYSIDEAFFKISAEENIQMDPQQKMVLKNVFHALEDAGLTSEDIKLKKVGVYIGASNIDNLWRINVNPDLINAHSNIGNTSSILANRVSYALKARGPSLTVDTACSSALTAVHFALEALRNKQCDIAIVGAVNLVSSPLTNIGFMRLGVASPSGQCRFGSADADGYVRGEGVGILILTRSDEVNLSHDLVHANILDCQIAQGVGPQHIAAPSLKDQISLLERIYRDNELSLDAIDYLEAHGTGTLQGDKIELSALSKGLRTSQRESILHVGSVKSNIGHLESAAGIASLIKAVLMTKYQSIPQSLHSQRPRSDFDFTKEKINIPSTLVKKDISIAGINAYGFGGSIAHAIITKVPQNKASFSSQAIKLPFLLTAENRESLVKRIHEISEFVAKNEVNLQDLSYSLLKRKNHYSHFVLFWAATKDDFCEKIKNSMQMTRSKGSDTKATIIFPGAGGNYLSPMKSLSNLDSQFRDRIKEIITTGGLDLDQFLKADALADIHTYQLGAYAYQIAFYELLTRFGLRIDSFSGHSMGEVSALVAAGRMSWEKGLELVSRRSQCLKSSVGLGHMVWFPQSLETLEKNLLIDSENWEISAINGPKSIVLSTFTEPNQDFLEKWEAKIVKSFGVPAHSSKISVKDLENFEANISDGKTVFSTLLARPALNNDVSEHHYWAEQIVRPVQFEKTLKAIYETGVRLFIDIGGIFGNDFRDGLPQDHKSVSIKTEDLNSLNSIENLIARIYQQGGTFNWNELLPERVTFVRTPSYPWNETSRGLKEANYNSSRALGRNKVSHLSTFQACWKKFFPDNKDILLEQCEISVEGDEEILFNHHYLITLKSSDDPILFVQKIKRLLVNNPLNIVVQGNSDLSPIRSIVKCLRYEYPEIKFTTIETNQIAPKQCLQALLGSDVKRVDDDWYKEELLEVNLNAAESIPSSVIISGGLGALGLESAKWLAAQGTKDIILLTRKDFPQRIKWREEMSSGSAITETINQILKIEDAGSRVHIVQADVSLYPDLVRVKDYLDQSLINKPSLAIHAAGMLADGLFKDLNLENFLKVIDPKVNGLINLSEVFNDSIKKIVSFSSLSRVIGSPGQTNYALANSLMSSILKTPKHISLELAPFESKGLAASTTTSKWLNSAGVPHLQLNDIGHFLSISLADTPSSLICVPAHGKTWLASYFKQTSKSQESDLLKTLKAIVTDFRPDLMVDENVPLSKYGLDSITAVGLRYKISQLGIETPPLNYFLSGPSLVSIARAISNKNEQSFGPLINKLKVGQDGGRLLICFPFAGSHGYKFSKLIESLPDDVTVFSVERPKHHATPIERDAYYDQIAQQIDMLRGDLMFFGYSLGANIAFNIARKLKKPPQSIVAASSRPINENWHFEKLAAAEDSEVGDWIFSLGNIPRRDLIDESIIKGFKQDLSWTKALREEDLNSFDSSSIYSLRGEDDPVISLDDLMAWKSIFPRAIVTNLSGDHFFVSRHAKEVCSMLIN